MIADEIVGFECDKFTLEYKDQGLKAIIYDNVSMFNEGIIKGLFVIFTAKMTGNKLCRDVRKVCTVAEEARQKYEIQYKILPPEKPNSNTSEWNFFKNLTLNNCLVSSLA